MKAVVSTGLGEGWIIEERPDPVPGTGEVLVAIEASGVCYTDIQQLREPVYGCTFPRIPGHEAVGTVSGLGSGVDDLQVGDRVGVAYAQSWCGRCHHCALGRYEHCGAISATGVTVDGGHAELAVFHAGSVERVPDGLDPIQAAPVFCAGFTVYSGLQDAELRPGERCAVIGLGGLGHLGVQYAAAMGAEVFVVSRSERKAGLARELGADHVVIVEPGEVGRELRRLGGVDVIVHTANGIEEGLHLGLRSYGRMSLLGVSRDSFSLTPTDLCFGNLRVIGSMQGPRTRLREVLALHLRCGAKTVTETYSLDEAHSAFERVASGRATFRAVLVPNHTGTT
jgi:D-arabinose 1-dehydrogenase-like Zn-dependent alcohol dehydrogenase